MKIRMFVHKIGGSVKMAVGMAALFAALAAGVASAAVQPDAIFSNGMVLQQGMQAPVWGKAAPGEKVTVSFAGQNGTAVADSSGKWMVKLAPLTVSAEPREMSISGATGSTPVIFKNVLVGEVWVGSGQSNMQQPVKTYTKGDERLAKQAGETYPNVRLLLHKKGWAIASPETCQDFSAQTFSFGVQLHKELNVPVGLMVGAIGGTPSGRWLSREMFEADPACKAEFAKVAAAYNPEAAKKKHEEEMAKYQKMINDAKTAGKPAPRVKAPALAPNPADTLKIIGNLFHPHIEPLIPYGIRGVLWDQGESGTAVPGVAQFTMMGALIKGWRKQWGQGDFPFIYVQKPSGGGCAWDQSNPLMLKLAPVGKKPLAAFDTKSGLSREEHIAIMRHPNTAMAICTDLGAGIHPPIKSGYAERDCRVALGFVYGRKIEYYGPIYASHKTEGNKVRVSFTHIGQGLAALGGGNNPEGFSIAGADMKFVWADAVIDGDTVVVSSKAVSAPVAVRYAWGPANSWATLFNKDGLPAVQFRTDKENGETGAGAVEAPAP